MIEGVALGTATIDDIAYATLTDRDRMVNQLTFNDDGVHNGR